jgi:hypothetical protein
VAKNNNTNISELSEKVLNGVKRAVRKLIEENAANNESMIIGDKDGNFEIVSAKELLQSFSK